MKLLHLALVFACSAFLNFFAATSAQLVHHATPQQEQQQPGQAAASRLLNKANNAADHENALRVLTDPKMSAFFITQFVGAVRTRTGGGGYT